MYFTVYKITVVVDLTMWMDAPSLLMFVKLKIPRYHLQNNNLKCFSVAVTERDMIYIWGQPPPVNLEEMSLRGVAVSDSEDSDTGQSKGSPAGSRAEPSR